MAAPAPAAFTQHGVPSSISAPTIEEQPLSGWTSNASIWIQETPPQAQLYPTLVTSHTTAGAAGQFDVVVVGGGIVGVTAAFLLKKAGKKVALVEARRIGCGTTGSSTCKLTSQQNLIYTNLKSKYDEPTAKLYGEMQETAITQVEELVNALKIDCDFKRKPHATWTSDQKQVKNVQAEYELAKKLGLPAELVSAAELELPASIGVQAAVRFQNQGEFNSYKFCVGLAKHIDGEGCKVYEGTQVTDVKDESGTHIVKTLADASLQADRVILATHLPIMDRSGHFSMFSPSKSHVVAVKLAKGDGTHKQVGAGDVRGMYINCDPEKRSIRTLQDASVLIVSGESFETGDETDVEKRYTSLEEWAAKHFAVEKNLTRWSAMDYYTSSIIPYIGYLYRGSDTIYTATAFSKWGLTNGVAAGMIFRDMITGVKNPWADMVDARRWDLLKTASGTIQETFHTQKHLISDKIKARFAPNIDTLKPGEGGTVKAGGEIVGAYLDKTGKYHLVTPVCTHLGCNVLFNTTDRTWDCPCHGSQFDIDGAVIHGPAVKPLCKRDDLKW